MKKRQLFIVATMIIAAFAATAAPVSVDRAERVAYGFLKSQGLEMQLFDITPSTPFTEFYVFVGLSGKGFVLVSADDCVTPILGYSGTNQFVADNMPDHVRGWLDDYENAIRLNRKRNRQIHTSNDVDNSVADIWEQLESGAFTPPLSTAVPPLVSTTWSQSPYYNNLCPYDSTAGSHVVTGCVATATAQIMKYHGWPAMGYGNHSYTHPYYGTLSADFASTNYAWDSMPNSLTSGSDSVQVAAVATLLYHVGVAVEMYYGVRSSAANNYNVANAPSSEQALIAYFKYSSDIHAVFREAFTDEAWCGMLRAELDARRPILYSGRGVGGHSFVCDGYDANGYFHFNWGWAGNADGYFAMGSLNPITGGVGGNGSGTFNLNNVAIIGIHPDSSWNSSAETSVSVASNNVAYGTVTGGGTYEFGSEYMLTATANSGCRFVRWSDNNSYNPRIATATGGTRNLTAYFEPLQGDTLSYTTGAVTESIFGSNASDDKYWGIRLPATVFPENRILKAVQFYVAAAGSYEIQVRQGSPYNQVRSQSVVCTNDDLGYWKNVVLHTPVAVNDTDDLYLVVHSSLIDYPAALATGCGNADGFLWGDSLEAIYPYYPQYCAAVRGIFATPPSPFSGDTISYCENNPYVTTIGISGNTTWGIRFPATAFADHEWLTDVMLHTTYAGSYTLNVYQNETGLGTAAYTQTVTLSDSGWHSIPITPPLRLTDSTLWITFTYAEMNNPANAVAALADTCSSLIFFNNTWMSLYRASGWLLDYSWMIKAVILRDTGSVCQAGISTFPYAMGFEADEDLQCWSFYDVDGDGYGWTCDEFAGRGYGHNGSPSEIASASYVNNVGALTPDNWMVTPCFNLGEGLPYTLTWFDKAFDSLCSAEHYAVYVSTRGNAVADFDTATPQRQYTLSSTHYTKRRIDLSAYAGQSVWIAFRHYNSANQYRLMIDDISITETSSGVTYIVDVNDPAMGTTTPPPGSYNATVGDSVLFTATPATGYHFVVWRANFMGVVDSTVHNPALFRFGSATATIGPIVFSAVFAPDTPVDVECGSNMACDIYPCPASSSVTISLSGVGGRVNIALIDPRGGTVLNRSADADSPCTLNVSALARGTYFVRIIGPSVNIVRKLVLQ